MKTHHLPGYIQSIYLIEYKHGLLLLDGCCRTDIKAVEHYICNELNRPITDLKTVVVTHMHPDHAGGAHLFREISGCLVVSANKQQHWYHGINGILMHWIDVVLAVYVGWRINKGVRNVMYSRKLKADCTLNEGDCVPHFEDWTVLETPGHTDRDLTLWHPQQHCVYVADLIIKLKSRFISPFPVFHPNKYKASLNKIRQLAPKKLLLAHGGILSMDDDDYDQMLRHAPTIPRTPLRATIRKFKRITRRHPSQ